MVENRILIDKMHPTSLAIVKGKNCVALRIDVDGREHKKLPGNLSSIQVEFFNKGNKPEEYLFFTRANSFSLILLPVARSFLLNYDFCLIKGSVGNILEKEQIHLYFSPPIPL